MNIRKGHGCCWTVDDTKKYVYSCASSKSVRMLSRDNADAGNSARHQPHLTGLCVVEVVLYSSTKKEEVRGKINKK